MRSTRRRKVKRKDGGEEGEAVMQAGRSAFHSPLGGFAEVMDRKFNREKVKGQCAKLNQYEEKLFQ